jgi:hypothetical protein
MQQVDAERVFKTDSYNTAVLRGLVVGLHYSGPHCIQSCQKVISMLKQIGLLSKGSIQDGFFISHKFYCKYN